MTMLDGNHYKVRASPFQRKMIRLWIETGATYPGTYAACGSGMIDIHASHVWGTLTESGVYRPRGQVGVPAPREVLDRRCLGCHGRTAPLHPQLLYNLTRPEKSMVLLAPLAKQAGGYGFCKHKSKTKEVKGPACFADTTDPDYQATLAFLRRASEALRRAGRFDMSEFRPADEYLREMKNYGILPKNFSPENDRIDVYRIDRAYWRSLWHKPARLSTDQRQEIISP